MDFENIVISPPDNYRFLNLIPIVINLYTFELRKSKNRLEVSFKIKDKAMLPPVADCSDKHNTAFRHEQ